MKKLNILAGIVFFVACSAIMAIKVNLTFDNHQGEGLLLTNTEVLAQGESDANSCFGSGDITCGNKSYRVRLN